jgi:hypothetical protein
VKQAIRNEIVHVFQVCKQLQGKDVEIIGWRGVQEAGQIIAESQVRNPGFDVNNTQIKQAGEIIIGLEFYLCLLYNLW